MDLFASKRGDHSRLGVTEDPLEVYWSAVEYVAGQLDVADPSAIKRYTERCGPCWRRWISRTGPVDVAQLWAAVERAAGRRAEVAGAVATLAINVLRGQGYPVRDEDAARLSGRRCRR
ncbi:hypothetical protein ABT297_38200 [Dactylosporangium sp. NPDC000555]|uniref:hypothetical protein n=1 Tax=Dactylosporangium sp. NPDC000555 TaxID=3154260 RepID=UPI00333279B1